MALIILSGYPCSGKSQRAEELRLALEARLGEAGYEGPTLRVRLISDESCNVQRDSYDDSRSEKIARGTVFATLTRELSKKSIVIMDGMNYIKGYRYQMYCAAREAEVRTCTIYVAAMVEECQQRHTEKSRQDRYMAQTFDNLVARFEEPNSMARWDSPLFTIYSTDPLPTEAIWQSITAGVKAPVNVAVLQTSKPPTDALQVLETTCSCVVNALASSPAMLSGSGGMTPLIISPETRTTINLPGRTISAAELQRHKRQFVSAHQKAVTQGAKGSFDWSESTVTSKFVEYLESHLNI